MENIISGYLGTLTLGDLKQFKNMGVIPLFAPSNGGPPYLVMKEALEGGLLTVTEVGQSGTVPELKVTNSADIAVLLVDGEELAGAKQNRVLNTTILLKEKSETVIPVSCTEQGRWSYATDRFHESGHMMSRKLRQVKAGSVNLSLRSSRRFDSDQGAVWEGIHDQHVKARVQTRTHAMKDVYEAKMQDLNDYVEKFPCEGGQRGLLVMLNGKVAGLDLVSRDSVYRGLHPKLVKSYAMDAILEEKQGNGGSVEIARAFLQEIQECEEKKYRSVGHGWDHRFEGKKFVGSALVYKETVIHAAFFTIEAAEKAGSMAGFSRRRGFRA
jgi:hypothetical protein